MVKSKTKMQQEDWVGIHTKFFHPFFAPCTFQTWLNHFSWTKKCTPSHLSLLSWNSFSCGYSSTYRRYRYSQVLFQCVSVHTRTKNVAIVLSSHTYTHTVSSSHVYPLTKRMKVYIQNIFGWRKYLLIMESNGWIHTISTAFFPIISPLSQLLL